MTVYMLFLAVLILTGWYILNDKTSKKTQTICLMVTAGAVLAIMSCRYAIGYDYFSYEEIFKATAAAPISELIKAHKTEMGFYLFTKLVSMITTNYQVFLLFCNIIMVGCVFWVIYRYSPIWWVSSVLYLTLQFMPHSMNLLRQSLAASILFAGWGFLKKGKLLPYVLVVLLASTFHISALIMIPAYFLLRAPFKLPVLAAYGGGTLVAYFAFKPLLTFAVTYLFPQYAFYLDSSIYGGQNGFSLSVVPLICLVTALVAAKPLIERDKSNSILIYAMFASFVFYLFMSKMYIVERFSIYFFMYAMLIFPEIIAMLAPEPLPNKAPPAVKIAYKNKWQNQQVVIILIVFGSIFYMIYASVTGFHKTYPYVSIFNKQDAVENQEYFEKHLNR